MQTGTEASSSIVQSLCGCYLFLLHLQDVITAANSKWGGLEGLQQQRALQKQEHENNKYAEIARAKQQRDEWEASDVGHAQLALEAEHSAEAAAVLGPDASLRRDELLAALSEHGVRLRQDSRLCNEYIRKGLGNAVQIADIMVGMKWLFDNTDYAARVKKVRCACAHSW